jgi:hypothetical protein
MEVKASTEDIVAKASMEEAALTARTEWEAEASMVEALVMLEAEVPVMSEAALRVEAAAMLVVEAAVTTEH